MPALILGYWTAEILKKEHKINKFTSIFQDLFSRTEREFSGWRVCFLHKPKDLDLVPRPDCKDIFSSDHLHPSIPTAKMGHREFPETRGPPSLAYAPRNKRPHVKQGGKQGPASKVVSDLYMGTMAGVCSHSQTWTHTHKHIKILKRK